MPPKAKSMAMASAWPETPPRSLESMTDVWPRLKALEAERASIREQKAFLLERERLLDEREIVLDARESRLEEFLESLEQPKETPERRSGDASAGALASFGSEIFNDVMGGVTAESLFDEANRAEDLFEALTLFEKAANLGLVEAGYRAGVLYRELSLKGDLDPAESQAALEWATEWWSLGVHEDHRESLLDLGNCFYCGLGVEPFGGKSHATAVDLWERAAALGSKEARENLRTLPGLRTKRRKQKKRTKSR